MHFHGMASRLALAATVLLTSATLTLASQTHIVRSNTIHRLESLRRQQGLETPVPTRPRNGQWVIDNRFSIDDPDSPDLSNGSSASPNSYRAVEIARQLRGIRYVWGGTSRSGFDCSGFVRYVYARLGRHLPRTAAEQFGVGKPVHRNQLRPGDVLFFHTSRRGVSHVGIYIGNNNFIHAANPRKGVTVNDLSGYYSHRLVGARRLSS